MTTIKARTLDGSETDLPVGEIDAFRAGLEGPVLLSSDPGYDQARTIWNGMIDRRPALISRCVGVADVVKSVNFARERNLSLCMRSGGHNIAGLAVADGALMIDQSLRRGVWVDSSSLTVQANSHARPRRLARGQKSLSRTKRCSGRQFVSRYLPKRK